MKKAFAGIETNYQIMGRGMPLVLLHGWGCDWQIWHPIISRFSDRFQLVLPDLPAFGASANPPSAWSSAEYLTWLTAFLDETVGEDQACILLGHSFGGKLAALYAAGQPKTQLQRLVLVDASGLPDALTSSQQLKQKLVKLVPDFIKKQLSTSRRTTLLNQWGLATDYTTSTPAQREILKKVVREDISADLVKIQTPALLIWGETDADTPVTHAQRFKSLIPESTLAIIPKAGHFPFIDQPVPFMTQLNEFILK